MSTFCQRAYHRKCQCKGVGGQKSQNLVNLFYERPLMDTDGYLRHILSLRPQFYIELGLRHSKTVSICPKICPKICHIHSDVHSCLLSGCWSTTAIFPKKQSIASKWNNQIIQWNNRIHSSPVRLLHPKIRHIHLLYLIVVYWVDVGQQPSFQKSYQLRRNE